MPRSYKRPLLARALPAYREPARPVGAHPACEGTQPGLAQLWDPARARQCAGETPQQQQQKLSPALREMATAVRSHDAQLERDRRDKQWQQMSMWATLIVLLVMFEYFVVMKK